MHRFSFVYSLTLTIAVAATLLAPEGASAQRNVQYDTLSDSTPAAISCGFCAGERYGVIFRPLSGGLGLRADEFPLRLNTIEIAIARTTVTGSILSGGYTCMDSGDTSNVAMMVEAFAGATPPTSIAALPTGAWPGETSVFAMSSDLTPSTETTPGSRMYMVSFNSLAPTGGVMVDAPNTYIRVVVTIPAGGTSSSCTELGFSPPAAVGVRDDDGLIENRVNFLYTVGGSFGSDEWKWSEEISDPLSGESLNGDWAIRLDVTPMGTTTPDAGPPMVDAGTALSDAGTPPVMDSGTPPMTDAGSGPMCTTDSMCGGGERCIEGACRRIACTAASDCVGGMTCVEGMCRNLCTSNAECLGGEVCDTALGHCAPITEDGGCSCRAVGTRAARARPGAGFGLLLGLGLLVARRRRRARG